MLALSAGPPLNAVQPREQAGPQTGAQYEYQYHQAAAEALSLIDGRETECIYCDWHDDYVTDTVACELYTFNQVKTRSRSAGPWTLSEFFGLGRKKRNSPAPVTNMSSIFAHMWDHTRRFGTRCGSFVFVTDSDVDSTLKHLLQAAKDAKSVGFLPTPAATAFANLRTVLVKEFSDVTEESLFDFLSRLHVQEGVGSMRDLPGCRVLIANRILNASEVDLLLSEAKKIGADLVSAVRQRSQTVIQTLPDTVADLRAKKGLVIDDVLRLLSLSTEGYRQLRTGSRESVLALSRLHRLCIRNGVHEALIPDLCRLKTLWASWWIAERDHLDQADYLTLRSETADLLRAHSSAGLKFQALVEQAKAIAEKYRSRLTSSTPLTGELVVGLTIALAVEAEG